MESTNTCLSRIFNDKRMGPVLIIIAGICWGMIGIFTRGLSASGFDSVQITGARCGITALFLVICLLPADRSKLKIHPKDIWMFIGTGVFSIVFFNICYFTSIQYLTLSMASLLLYTAPFFVMIFSLYLFNEKMSMQKGLALLLSLAGCVFTAGIIGGGVQNITGTGILIGLGSGFGYALYTIFGRIAVKKYHPITITAYTFIVASVCLLPFCNIGEMISLAAGDSGILPNVLILTVVCTIIPYFLYTKGLETVEAGKASVMAFVEPMMATLIGIFFFNELMTFQNMAGVVLIFAGIVLLNLKIFPHASREK